MAWFQVSMPSLMYLGIDVLIYGFVGNWDRRSGGNLFGRPAKLEMRYDMRPQLRVLFQFPFPAVFSVLKRPPMSDSWSVPVVFRGLVAPDFPRHRGWIPTKRFSDGSD